MRPQPPLVLGPLHARERPASNSAAWCILLAALVLAILIAFAMLRGGGVATHEAHYLGFAGSNPAPATRPFSVRMPPLASGRDSSGRPGGSCTAGLDFSSLPRAGSAGVLRPYDGRRSPGLAGVGEEVRRPFFCRGSSTAERGFSKPEAEGSIPSPCSSGAGGASEPYPLYTLLHSESADRRRPLFPRKDSLMNKDLVPGRIVRYYPKKGAYGYPALVTRSFGSPTFANMTVFVDGRNGESDGFTLAECAAGQRLAFSVPHENTPDISDETARWGWPPR